MGKCQNCGNVIVMKEGEERCPACHQLPYHCWHCQTKISGGEKECPVCHFFICEQCYSCGKDCKIEELIMQTKEMGHREAIEYIYKSVQAPPRLFCPKNIPISYSHAKLRNMALRLKGKLVKNMTDTVEFRRRFDKIDNYPIGYQWTISKERNMGEYGYELREVSNLAVCMGIAKMDHIKVFGGDNKIKQEFDRYERTKETPCRHSNWANLLSMYCSKCKKSYPENEKNCSVCQNPLKERKSAAQFCNLPRSLFGKVRHGTQGNI